MELDGSAHTDNYNASFRDPVWLQTFPLNQQTVMHYFALSQFYDRNCNNERLKMQRLDLDRLNSMRGIEYEVLPPRTAQQPQVLFLIRKQRRMSVSKIKALAIYYVLDGTIYQAPNIQAMLASRLKKCSYRISEAYNHIHSAVSFRPNEGYSWNFSTEDKKMKPIPSEKLGELLKKQAEQQQKNRENNARIDSAIVRLVKKYAPDILGSSKDNEDTESEENPAKKQKLE